MKARTLRSKSFSLMQWGSYHTIRCFRLWVVSRRFNSVSFNSLGCCFTSNKLRCGADLNSTRIFGKTWHCFHQRFLKNRTGQLSMKCSKISLGHVVCWGRCSVCRMQLTLSSTDEIDYQPSIFSHRARNFFEHFIEYIALGYFGKLRTSSYLHYLFAHFVLFQK